MFARGFYQRCLYGFTTNKLENLYVAKILSNFQELPKNCSRDKSLLKPHLYFIWVNTVAWDLHILVRGVQFTNHSCKKTCQSLVKYCREKFLFARTRLFTLRLFFCMIWSQSAEDLESLRGNWKLILQVASSHFLTLIGISEFKPSHLSVTS